MFTGIIEEIGEVVSVTNAGSNIQLHIHSNLSADLKVDQSLSHNGVCLTVEKVDKKLNQHLVTAIDETLKKSNLASLRKGDFVNLERCLTLDGRLDGHMVQGHVDTVARCISTLDEDGSTLFTFELTNPHQGLIVEKGSITVNGVSLTAVDVKTQSFKVAIIPFTKDHTTFKSIKEGSNANIEFDILGKYVKAHLAHQS